LSGLASSFQTDEGKSILDNSHGADEDPPLSQGDLLAAKGRGANQPRSNLGRKYGFPSPVLCCHCPPTGDNQAE